MHQDVDLNSETATTLPTTAQEVASATVDSTYSTSFSTTDVADLLCPNMTLESPPATSSPSPYNITDLCPGADWFLFGDYCFYVSNTSANWKGAYFSCLHYNADLAGIINKTVQDFLTSISYVVDNTHDTLMSCLMEQRCHEID